MTDYPDDPNRTARDSFSIAFGALAIAAGAVGLFYVPGLLTPAGVLLALAGVIATEEARTFTTAAVVFAGLAWLAGMTIAILANHPIF